MCSSAPTSNALMTWITPGCLEGICADASRILAWPTRPVILMSADRAIASVSRVSSARAPLPYRLRSTLRRRSALKATMMLLALMVNAPHSGLRVIPQGWSTPAATGMAIRL